MLLGIHCMLMGQGQAPGETSPWKSYIKVRWSPETKPTILVCLEFKLRTKYSVLQCFFNVFDGEVEMVYGGVYELLLTYSVFV